MPTLEVDTDWDFSLEYKGLVYSDCCFSIKMTSAEDLQHLKLWGPCGSTPEEGFMLFAFDEAIEAIKANPNEHFSNRGGNRGFEWWPDLAGAHPLDELLQLRVIQKAFFGDVVVAYLGPHCQVWCVLAHPTTKDRSYVSAGVYFGKGGDEVRDIRMLSGFSEMVGEVQQDIATCWYPVVDMIGHLHWRKSWHGKVPESHSLPTTEKQIVPQETADTSLHQTLHTTLAAWMHGYCYTADDGGQLETAIMEHARCVLDMPGAGMGVMLARLEKLIENKE